MHNALEAHNRGERSVPGKQGNGNSATISVKTRCERGKGARGKARTFIERERGEN